MRGVYWSLLKLGTRQAISFLGSVTPSMTSYQTDTEERPTNVHRDFAELHWFVHWVMLAKKHIFDLWTKTSTKIGPILLTIFELVFTSLWISVLPKFFCSTALTSTGWVRSTIKHFLALSIYTKQCWLSINLAATSRSLETPWPRIEPGATGDKRERCPLYYGPQALSNSFHLLKDFLLTRESFLWRLPVS